MLHSKFDSMLNLPSNGKAAKVQNRNAACHAATKPCQIKNRALFSALQMQKKGGIDPPNRVDRCPKRKSNTVFCNLPKKSYVARANRVSPPPPPSNPYRIGTPQPALRLGSPTSLRDHSVYSPLAAFPRCKYRDISATAKYASWQSVKARYFGTQW